MDLELEARGRRQERDHNRRQRRNDSTENRGEEGLANLVHNDSKTDHPLKNHDVGITHTPERHVIAGIVHVRMDMTTEDQNRQRSGDPAMLPWTP